MPRNVCISGGADGSDLVWGNHARAVGHRVVHLSFEGHRTSAHADERVILTPAQLLQADPYLNQSIINLRRARIESRSDYVKSLLRRNWWQVRSADSVYAVSSLDRHGKVRGGTGYAVQMFIDRGVLTEKSGPWLYDQEQQQWFRWSRSWAQFQEVSFVPRPEERYAGIGTRDINLYGIKAIESLYARN